MKPENVLEAIKPNNERIANLRDAFMEEATESGFTRRQAWFLFEKFEKPKEDLNGN